MRRGGVGYAVGMTDSSAGPRVAAKRTVVVHLLADEGMPSVLAEWLAESLPSTLPARIHGGVQWRVRSTTTVRAGVTKRGGLTVVAARARAVFTTQLGEFVGSVKGDEELAARRAAAGSQLIGLLLIGEVLKVSLGRRHRPPRRHVVAGRDVAPPSRRGGRRGHEPESSQVVNPPVRLIGVG